MREPTLSEQIEDAEFNCDSFSQQIYVAKLHAAQYRVQADASTNPRDVKKYTEAADQCDKNAEAALVNLWREEILLRDLLAAQAQDNEERADEFRRVMGYSKAAWPTRG